MDMTYNEGIAFIESNNRNPSKHDDEERGLYLNWIKHNRKQLNAGTTPSQSPRGEKMERVRGKIADGLRLMSDV